MTTTHKFLTWLGAAVLICAFSLAAAAGTKDTAAVRATDGYASARPAAARRDLPEDGPETVSASAADAAKSTPQLKAEAATCCHHYIYDGFTEVFDDYDGDGFHTYLRISVDVDTDWGESDVYLEAYLRGTHGTWENIHSSRVFTVYGTSGFDDYEIETELVSGFPADYYDVLVEVYEARSGKLVAEFGPAQSPSFSLVPLEDVNRDGPFAPPIVSSYGSGGGGSASLLWLLFCAALGIVRRRRHS